MTREIPPNRIPLAFPWGTLGIVGSALLVALLPIDPEAVQYDRLAVVDDWQIWRLFSGQLAHWTTRMAVLDLGILCILGCSLECVMPARARLTLVLGAIGSALAIHALPPGHMLYRGASGIGTSLYVLGAIALWQMSPNPAGRGTAVVALLLLGGKIWWELATGQPLAAGPLPQGVEVAPLVHVAGVLAAFVALAIPLKGAVQESETTSLGT